MATDGYDPGGLVGKHFLQFVAPDEHERATGRYDALLRGEWDSSVADYRCLHRTGAVLELLSAPLALESSSRLSVTFDDIRFVRDTAATCPPQAH